MTLLRRLLLVPFLVLTAFAAAEPPEPDPTSPNAAARYLSLFQTMDKTLAKRAAHVQGGDVFVINTFDDTDFTADDVQRTLIDHQKWISEFIAASKLDACDFGLVIQPFGQLKSTPANAPLTPVLASTRILCADAWRCWADKDADAAVERLLALYRFAEHNATQKNNLYLRPIATSAQLGKACDITMQWINSPRSNMISADRRDSIRIAVETFNRADPAGLRSAVKTEARAFLDFADDQLRDDEVGERLVICISQVRAADVVGTNLFAELLKRAGAEDIDALGANERKNLFTEIAEQTEFMDHETLSARLGRAREILSTLDAAWDAPDAETRLRAMDKEVEEDKSGFLTAAFAGGFRARWEAWRDVQKRLGEVHAALTPALLGDE